MAGTPKRSASASARNAALDAYDLALGRLVRAAGFLDFVLSGLLGTVLELESATIPPALLAAYQREGIEKLLGELIRWKFDATPLPKQWEQLAQPLREQRLRRNEVIHAFVGTGSFGGQRLSQLPSSLYRRPWPLESTEWSPEDLDALRNATDDLRFAINSYSYNVYLIGIKKDAAEKPHDIWLRPDGTRIDRRALLAPPPQPSKRAEKRGRASLKEVN